MAGLGLDINEIIKSAYNTVLEILNAATETVGTDCLWARATPVINAEDIILQEYTLTLVGLECPKTIKVIVSNTDYSPGEYTIDLYGLNYVLPLEINIDIQEWNSIFGPNTMPLKGDIVYTQIYNKLFEVLSSELMYTIAAMPTYYKVVLSKYNPNSSRKETDEFRQSVEDLTISQEELFGDIISQEVADNNVTNETSYNNTTYVDPAKDFDIDSIVVKQVYGEQNKLISNAYYDFNLTNTNITYHSDLIYECNSNRNHLIFSCWCCSMENKLQEARINQLSFYSKDSKYWYFGIGTTLLLEVGDNVTITRGSLIKVNATIVNLECLTGYGIAIKNGDMLKANKKLTKWYENASFLKIYKTNAINMLTGYDNSNKIVFDIKYKTNEAIIQLGNVSKSFNVNLDITDWHYFLFDISPNSIRLIIHKVKQTELNKISDISCFDSTVNVELQDFTVSEFKIENPNSDILMCNIRLYENEYEIGETYLQDMYSPITRNANKLILVDSPNVPNKEIFITPVK